MICPKCGYKPNSMKNCSSCGHNLSLLEIAKKRDKWFIVFLCAMIGITIFFIINNIVVLTTVDDPNELYDSMRYLMIFKIGLYFIEIGFFVLLFRMQKKILRIYMFFLIVSAMINIFTLDITPLIFKYVPVYFIFRSQWDKFDN